MPRHSQTTIFECAETNAKDIKHLLAESENHALKMMPTVTDETER